MKKHLLSFAVMLSATLFTACMDTDSTTNKYPVAIANGVYVVGAGSEWAGKPACLTYYDYETRFATKDVFSQNNDGTVLGNGVLNDVMRYGDKTYVVSDGENSVFVADAKTMRIKDRIDMIKLLGNKGEHPRRITAYDGKIYVSTLGGYVAAIDTINYVLVGEAYEVGSCPEGLVIAGGNLFVANSDYAEGNASISIIDLSTRQTKTITHEYIRNPQDIAVNVIGSDIYYLDYGKWESDYEVQKYAGVYCYHLSNNTADLIVPDATGMACYGTSIFTFNNANGVEETTYTIYDIQTRTSKTFEPDGVEVPAVIAIDPITNYLFIASNRKKSGTQFADYSLDGYVNFYNPTTMEKINSFGCGAGPVRIAFNNSVGYIEY